MLKEKRKTDVLQQAFLQSQTECHGPQWQRQQHFSLALPCHKKKDVPRGSDKVVYHIATNLLTNSIVCNKAFAVESHIG